jgi:hypothetical protein
MRYGELEQGIRLCVKTDTEQRAPHAIRFADRGAFLSLEICDKTSAII